MLTTLTKPETPKPEIRKVKVKFLQSISGQPDQKAAENEKRYNKLADVMARTVDPNSKPPRPIYTAVQITEAVAAARALDSKIIPLGFTKDWSFRAGEEANVNAAIAPSWEEAGICEILPDKK